MCRVAIFFTDSSGDLLGHNAARILMVFSDGLNKEMRSNMCHVAYMPLSLMTPESRLRPLTFITYRGWLIVHVSLPWLVLMLSKTVNRKVNSHCLMLRPMSSCEITNSHPPSPPLYPKFPSIFMDVSSY